MNWLRKLAAAPNSAERMTFAAIRFAVEYRFIKPSTAGTRRAAAASASSCAGWAVGAGGFSMNRGRPRATPASPIS